MTSESNGFAAMGKPIPYNRKQAAYDAAKSMGVEDCFGLVNSVSEQLERDKPFEALNAAHKHTDLTGAYRIVAHLLTGSQP